MDPDRPELTLRHYIVLGHLTGASDAATIAADLGWPVAEVAKLFADLEAHGLISPISEE